jgi:ribonuclease P protein component
MPIGRVQLRSSLAALRQHGRRAGSGALRVTFMPATSADSPQAQVAYAIGRQVGSAVVRNRLRRQLRAACAELDPPPGTYLVSAGPTAAGRRFHELRTDLAAALTAVGALQRTDA